MPPGENALGPLRAQKLPADKKTQHFPAEQLLEPGVVDTSDLAKDAGLVLAALGHEKMQVRVEVDPLAPLLEALGVAGRAEAPRAAGEHDQPLLAAVRAPDAREPAARVAAVQITLHHLLDDRAEEAVLPLEPALVLRQEALEMMEQHPVEGGALRMPSTIHSCHDRKCAPGNGPTSGRGPHLLEKTERLGPLSQAREGDAVNMR